MNAHIDATRTNARAWMKWLALEVGDEKVTDCLKSRVTEIKAHSEDGPENIRVSLVVSSEYAKKILQMRHEAIFLALAQGYRDQYGVTLLELSIEKSTKS